MDKLLPCPYCGVTGMSRSSRGAKPPCYILCANCQYNTGDNATPEAAVTAWNQRTPGWIKIEDSPDEWWDGRDCLVWATSKFGHDPFRIRIARFSLRYEEWFDGATYVLVHSVRPLPAAPEVE